MPKVKAPGLYAEKDINFSRAIAACMKRTGKAAEEIAKKSHVSLRTHYSRMKNPGDIRVSELRVYIREAHIPPEDILEALYLDGKR